MSFLDTIARAKSYLEQQGRVSLRALRREFVLDDDALDELVEELVDVQRVAVREGAVLVWKQGVTGVGGHGGTGSATTTPHPLSSSESRKVITVIFADLMGSTALQERLDPESVNRVMDAYYQAVRGPVEAAGGSVVQLLGDGVMSAFGIPRIAEDDALRAVRAAVGVQRAFREFVQAQRWLNVPIGLRVAVNTGEVVVNEEHPAGIGDPLNVAARLQQEARDGEVIIGQATRRLVADAVTLERAGVFALKGRAETVTAYRVVSLERPSGATTAAFVGRADELARLTAVYDRVRTGAAARLAVVLGSPGLGKSRLINELGQRLGDGATLMIAQCDAAGGGTFAPVVAALRESLSSDATDPTDRTDQSAIVRTVLAALPADDAERARIANGITALLAGSPAAPEETFFVIRRLLTALAQSKPVVLVIDDLHWAEPLLLDLVEHLIQWGSGVLLYVLVGARPELRELRSSLVTTGGIVADVVTLGGLDAGAAMRLAANVIGAADLPASLAAKVLATSEGNPLFVSELVRMLVDEGVIEQQGDRWIVSADLAAFEMPPTIHALLAARIERLRPEERTVLEHASVVGRHFSRSAVAALLGHNGDGLDARLEALRRTELIEADTGWFLGEPLLRFHHVLIRDAAYRRLLKGTRAALHAQLADWIETRVGDNVEHDETIGWHLEQAHQHLRELGPLDERASQLGERAAQRLAGAGRRALAGDDVALAASLLGRAIDRLGSDDPARADLALDWCEALLSAGDVGPAAKAIDELGRFALEEKGLGGYGVTGLRVSENSTVTANPLTLNSLRLRAWHTCFTGQLTALAAPQQLQATVSAVEAAAKELGALGDSAGEAKAHSVHAQALARLGRVGACEAALDKALAAARKAGDRRRANAVLAGAPVAALWGPSPVTRASGRCLDVVRVLRITQGAPAVEAVALSCQGVLEALRGRTDAARRMIASSRKMVEDLGIAHRLFEADVFAGRIDLIEGDAPAAERTLRAAYDGLRDLGLGIDAARAGALLARAQLAQGKVAEAETASRESEALAGDDLQAAIAWRGVRAEALAQRGETNAAVELAQAGVAIAAATDALLDHADARLALAAVLRAAGREREADTEVQRAKELWEAKGATLLAERTREPADRRTTRAGQPSGQQNGVKPKPVRRRVHPNRATTCLARFDRIVAERDADALAEFVSDRFELTHHATVASYGRRGWVTTWRSLFCAEHFAFRYEELATLGDSLLLHRHWVNAEGFAEEHLKAAGAIELEEICFTEIDADDRVVRFELFAFDHLGDAIVRLYARHAELQPEGAERVRAEQGARSIAFLMGGRDPNLVETAFAPDIETNDHRMAGFGRGRGIAWMRRLLGSAAEVAEGVVEHVDDVLGLAPDALLLRCTLTGTERVGGGAFASTYLRLRVLGPHGLVTHAHTFDADREEDALVLFDEVGRGAEPLPHTRRRVCENAAVAVSRQYRVAALAGDMATIEALTAHDIIVHHHPTGAVINRDGAMQRWRILNRAEGLRFGEDLIATLGDWLALGWDTTSFERLSDDGLEFGASELKYINLFESDEHGQAVRVEVFAEDRLGDAVARLYARYAELLPQGPARVRAVATAAAVAAMLTRSTEHRLEDVMGPDLRVVDHRTVGIGPVQGPHLVQRWRAVSDELADDQAFRIEEVLALSPDGLLRRTTQSGTIRASGGTFETTSWALSVFGSDGRQTRFEVFDVGREADALACFDELTKVEGEPSTLQSGSAGASPSQSSMLDQEGGRCRRVRPNAASMGMLRVQAALDARDFAAFAALTSDPYEEIHHPTGTTYGRAAMLASVERFLRLPGATTRHEFLATLGNALVLHRRWMGASGAGRAHFDVGEFEKEEIGIVEDNRNGSAACHEIFSADRLGDAIVCLYRRYANLLPEGRARTRAEATAHTIAAMVAPPDLARYASALAPNVDFADHRTVGFAPGRGADKLLRGFASLLELAEDVTTRVDEVLALEPDAVLLRWTTAGTDRASGGAFESTFLLLWTFGEDGRVARDETFDAHREAEALARFDDLCRRSADVQPLPPFVNAAARMIDAMLRSWLARDWDGVAAVLSPALRMSDRRRMMRLEIGYDEFIAQLRMLFEQPSSRWHATLVATRGERLSLHRTGFHSNAGHGGGPLAVESFTMTEVDVDGRCVAVAAFDVEQPDLAYAELDRRWDAGEGGRYAVGATWARVFVPAFARRDWDAIAALHAPTFVGYDHRLVGWGTVHGAAALLETIKAMCDLVSEVRMRLDHLRVAQYGFIADAAWLGTADGGAIEIPFLSVVEFDTAGRIQRQDFYDHRHVDDALARFETLAAPRL